MPVFKIKNKKQVLAIIIAGFVVIFLFFFIRGPEDTWLCQDGQWVRHGNPGAPQPTGDCPGKPEPAKSPETIETEKGDNFSVALASNPTTGYEWELEFDSSYLRLIDREYTPSNPKLIGSGGEEKFNLLALKSGETEIKFSYLRPWKEEKALKELVYKIVIK